MMGNHLIKRIFLLCAILLLSGCFFPCLNRRFVADEGDRRTPVIDNWVVSFGIHSKDYCSRSDSASCEVMLVIDGKYLDEDSLKNVAVHFDSLYLEFGERVYKRINEDSSFSHAEKPIWRYKHPPPKPHDAKYFSIVNSRSRETMRWPLIPKEVKAVDVTLFVSFMYPNDGHIESVMVRKRLYERKVLVFASYDNWKDLE